MTLRKIEIIQGFLIASILMVGVIVWFLLPHLFIADDSFFYLVIARHIVQVQEQTFSGVTLTNGIHPLWLYVLTGWSFLVDFLNADLLYQPISIVPLSSLLMIGGTSLLWKSAQQLTVSPAIFVGIPLTYMMAFGILGSEGHLLYFSLSAVIYVSGKNVIYTSYGAGMIGMMLAMTFLARLDMIFFIVCYYVWYLVVTRNMTLPLIAGITALVPAGGYILSNFIWFGGLTPVSGWLKSTFPSFNFRGFTYSGLTSNISGYNILSGLLPCLIAVIITFYVFKRFRVDSNRSLILPFLFGSLIHWGYVASFTSGYTDWPWYYVLPIMTVGFSIALGASTLDGHNARQSVLVGIIFVGFLGFISLKVATWTPTRGYILLAYLQTNQITQQTLLVSDYPGTVAYYTQNHVIAADMLTANRQFIADLANSPDAFEYLKSQAAARGIDIDYLIWIGNDQWFNPNEDFSEIIYYHPKNSDDIIGTITPGTPHYADGTIPLVVWSFP